MRANTAQVTHSTVVEETVSSLETNTAFAIPRVVVLTMKARREGVIRGCQRRGSLELSIPRVFFDIP